MKKSLSALLIATLFSMGSLCAHAGEVMSQAIVLKVTGTAQAAADAQSKPVALKAGDKLSQGEIITTGDKSGVQLQVFNGGVALIGPKAKVGLEKLSITTSNGVVTKQTALLDDQEGLIRSLIDPAHKDINDYGIRTPKGIFRDQDTDYTVNVVQGRTQVLVTTGAVNLIVNGVSHPVAANCVVTVSQDGTVTVSAPYNNAGDAGDAFVQAAGAAGSKGIAASLNELNAQIALINNNSNNTFRSALGLQTNSVVDVSIQSPSS